MRLKVPSFLLRDRITVEPLAGSGAYGDTYDAPRTIKAHVEPTNRLVLDRDGQTARAEANVIIRPEDGPIPLESRLTWGGKTYRVLQAGAMPDEARPSHRELTIG